MAIKNKRRDLISSLPDEILHHILSFLPLEWAVQTSILSKRWMHLYKFIPVLEFFFEPNADRGVVDYTFANRFQELYRATRLQKLATGGEVGEISLTEVKRLVEFATARSVQELEIILLCHRVGVFELPYSLYSTQSIERLYLCCVSFSPPSSFSGFRLLKNLSFLYSTLSDEGIRALVSTCPLLEELKLGNCSGLEKAKITAPNLQLKRLAFNYYKVFGDGLELEVWAPNLVYFQCRGSLMPIHLKNLHCLNEVELYYTEIEGTNFGYVRAMLDELARVKVLHVGTWFSQFMAEEHYMIGSRCTAFQNLKRFCWFGPLKAKSHLIALVAFLGDCPSLEKIELDFNYFRERPYAELEGEEGELHVGCLFQLQTIIVCGYAGVKCEMELIKLLLQNAVVLDTLFITFREHEYGWRSNEQKAKMLEEQVSLLPKTSSHARVLFG